MFCFVSNLSYTSKSRRFVIVGLVHAMCGSVILEPWFLSLPYIETEKMKKCASCLAVDTSLCKCLCLAFMSRVFPLSLQLGWRKGTLGMWTLSWQNSHLWLNLQKKKQIRLRPEAPHHWRGRALASPPASPLAVSPCWAAHFLLVFFQRLEWVGQVLVCLCMILSLCVYCSLHLRSFFPGLSYSQLLFSWVSAQVSSKAGLS